MPRRPSSEPSVFGPYERGNLFRVHVVTRRGGKRQTAYQTFATRALAEAFIAGARDEAQGITVTGAVDAFLAWKRSRDVTPGAIDTDRRRLTNLLRPVLQRPIRAVNGRGAELYAQSQVYPERGRQGQSKGDRRAADTHRGGLTIGKQWGKWCVRQRYLRASPFADVEPVGRCVLGADKPRLTVDESRQLEAWCLARPGHPGATIALAYLYLGARASELVNRNARDLDDNGSLLQIGKTKTAAGRRRLRLPTELGAMLCSLADGRATDAPIFVYADGRRWTRYKARHAVRAACKDAGVTVLPPQALRRTQSTLAEEAGETALAVARHLGHATGAAPAVTHRSYVGRDAQQNARADRAMRALKSVP